MSYQYLSHLNELTMSSFPCSELFPSSLSLSSTLPITIISLLQLWNRVDLIIMAVKDNMNLPRNLHLLQYVPDANMIIWHNFYCFILSKYCLWRLSLKADSKTKIAERNTKLISAFQTEIFCLRPNKIWFLNGIRVRSKWLFSLHLLWTKLLLGVWGKQ